MTKRDWKEISKFEEIRFEEYHGIAKITINRPRYRNAFTPRTTLELSQAFAACRELSCRPISVRSSPAAPVFSKGKVSGIMPTV